MKKILAISLLLAAIGCAEQLTQVDVSDASLSASLEEKSKLAVDQASQALVGTLTNQLQSNGPAASIAYCNARALPLTQEVAAAYGIRLKRTSLKWRNPENAPDDLEREVLELWEATPPQGPAVKQLNENTYRVYLPIVMKPLCLNCHGKAQEQIAPSTWEALQTTYPDDRAFDYLEGDLRGMWTAEFSIPNGIVR